MLLRGCAASEEKLQHTPRGLLYISTVHILEGKMAAMRTGKPLPLVSISWLQLCDDWYYFIFYRALCIKPVLAFVYIVGKYIVYSNALLKCVCVCYDTVFLLYASINH